MASTSPVAAQGLRGSRGSLDLQNRVAQDHDFSFLRTASQVQRFVTAGYLVKLVSNADFELHHVSHPYARPEVRLFVERLAAQYRRACGDRLVVTSLTRPDSEQPRNASDLSVHPTGMAVDLRLSTNRACRRWLEAVLVDLERARVIEATRERRPAHYHIAVFPRSYVRYVKSRQSMTQRTALTSGEARTQGAGPPSPTRYRVRSGDSLWSIARRYGTTIARIQRQNALASSRIYSGQVLEISVGDGVASAPIRYHVREGDSLWNIARKHGTTVAEIRSTNALASSRILPGQVLDLPVSN